MYNTVNITEADATKFFFNDPKLVLLGLADEEIAFMKRDLKYTFMEGSHYIGVQNTETKELVAILRYEYFTTHTINIHMYISSKYHHTDVPRSVAECLKEYTVNELKIYKVIIIVPSSCHHIHQFAPKHGFKLEGTLTNSFQWREQVVDLLIYGMSLKGDK